MLDSETTTGNTVLEDEDEDGNLHIEDEDRSDPIEDEPEGHFISTVYTLCGIVIFIMEDGSTIPKDIDWYGSNGQEKADCTACRIKAGLSTGP